MIDLWEVAGHALWIAGLAVLLAAASWVRWAAGEEGAGGEGEQGRGRMRSLRAAWVRRGMQRWAGVGLALFAAGMAARQTAFARQTASARHWWMQALWALVAVGWAAWGWRKRRE